MSKIPKRLRATVESRAEKKIIKRNKVDDFFHRMRGHFLKKRSINHYQSWVERIINAGQSLHSLSAHAFAEEVQALKAEILHQGMTDALLIKSFACAREAAGRSVGMYHFDTQIMGGLAMFHGNVIEMQTGEGKTLTAVLPAAAAALMGVPVHVVTVNAYLAQRDAQIMEPIYQLLGLSVGCILDEQSVKEKQGIYGLDVVYCTNKDLVFDYLKDQLLIQGNSQHLTLSSSILQGQHDKSEQLMQRGLHFAIVDEADSVLMDEARTPLIISGENKKNAAQVAVYHQAMKIAGELQQEKDYSVNRRMRLVRLTEMGEAHTRELCDLDSVFWRGRVRRRELVEKALTALLLFEKDKHYVVVDGKINIVDEHTGRIMPDRSWEQGLHQLIEIKEQCETTSARSTLVKISYQRFFRLFHHLSGMTGTAKEVASELWNVYHLSVLPVPSHKPNKRIYLPPQLHVNDEAKWEAVISRCEMLSAQGRAVLVGTASVGLSEYLSQRFVDVDIEHRVLNAKHDSEEAEIVALAGQPGKITIATNMAGRGTDIKLADEVRVRGGLHVILTEFHDASRIDRQLEGRCARQGDPGSFEMIVSLQDGLLVDLKVVGLSGVLLSMAKTNALGQALTRNLGLYLLKHQQRKREHHHATIRTRLLHADEVERDMLAFTGQLV